MEKDLSNYRKTYNKGQLLLEEAPDNPLELFQKWFYQVDKHFPEDETNAMTISTIGLDGFPRNRVVLLKKYTYEGFIFYTNYNSEKGKAIAKNPKVCLSFFWAAAERQVIVKGIAEKVSENVSEGYFESRPRGSQLSAWVSKQSEIVPNRAYLETQLKHVEEQFNGKEIPKPKHWGGYLVKPSSVEFWQGRPNRLHDRITYSLDETFNWNKVRLAP